MPQKQEKPQCEFCLKRSTFIFTHSISTLTKQGACRECQSKLPASLPSNNLTRIQSKSRMMPYGVGNNYRRGVQFQPLLSKELVDSLIEINTEPPSSNISGLEESNPAVRDLELISPIQKSEGEEMQRSNSPTLGLKESLVSSRSS